MFFGICTLNKRVNALEKKGNAMAATVEDVKLEIKQQQEANMATLKNIAVTLQGLKDKIAASGNVTVQHLDDILTAEKALGEELKAVDMEALEARVGVE